MNSPEDRRKRNRRVAVECGALIDLLNEIYPASRLPDLNATDREIGEWIGQRKLVEHLNTLRGESIAEGSVLKGGA